MVWDQSGIFRKYLSIIVNIFNSLFSPCVSKCSSFFFSCVDPGPAMLPPACSQLLWDSISPPCAWSVPCCTGGGAEEHPGSFCTGLFLLLMIGHLPWDGCLTTWAEHLFATSRHYLNVPETSNTELVFQLPAQPENRSLSRTCIKIELQVMHVVLLPQGHFPHALDSSDFQLCHMSQRISVSAPTANALPLPCVCTAARKAGHCSQLEPVDAALVLVVCVECQCASLT